MGLERLQDAAALGAVISYSGFIIHLYRQDGRSAQEKKEQRVVLRSQNLVFRGKLRSRARETIFNSSRRDPAPQAEHALRSSGR